MSRKLIIPPEHRLTILEARALLSDERTWDNSRCTAQEKLEAAVRYSVAHYEAKGRKKKS